MSNNARPENRALSAGATAEAADASAPAPAPPCTIVVFGAHGDMAHRLLLPALYKLGVSGLLDENFEVIGVDHNPSNDDAFRKDVQASMQKFTAGKGDIDPKTWDWLAQRLHYLAGDFEKSDTYRDLADKLKGKDGAKGDRNVLFYLATAARFFGVIVDHLAEAGLTGEDHGWRRVVVEKPFGNDLPSARALNARILSKLSENQTYRIDHFLGKETVQNIAVLRFANGIFEPLWNRRNIDHVQITVAETVGVEDRGKFYDATGALRDMVPNHLFQLLAMIAMEPPNSFDADAMLDEKVKVIEAIHPLIAADVAANAVRGQYSAGTVNGQAVDAYLKAANVAPDSRTETFVALKLTIDNWRWSGVPFYLRTGKAMTVRRTEIAIQFKQAPFALFRDTPVEKLTPNFLVFHIDPEEGISLHFEAKIPGPAVHLSGVRMDFQYADYFKRAPNTGYETLLYDCMIGDRTLFQRADNVEAGWQVVQPVLDAWAKAGPPATYAAGSAGPAEAETLLARDGRHWRPLNK
jgi:glucose-6-phosphate 1-dehydrogenase